MRCGQDLQDMQDWKIIFQTIKTVLKREGINSETAATMEEFFGNENRFIKDL